MKEILRIILIPLVIMCISSCAPSIEDFLEDQTRMADSNGINYLFRVPLTPQINTFTTTLTSPYKKGEDVSVRFTTTEDGYVSIDNLGEGSSSTVLEATYYPAGSHTVQIGSISSVRIFETPTLKMYASAKEDMSRSTSKELTLSFDKVSFIPKLSPLNLTNESIKKGESVSAKISLDDDAYVRVAVQNTVGLADLFPVTFYEAGEHTIELLTNIDSTDIGGVLFLVSATEDHEKSDIVTASLTYDQSSFRLRTQLLETTCGDGNLEQLAGLLPNYNYSDRLDNLRQRTLSFTFDDWIAQAERAKLQDDKQVEIAKSALDTLTQKLEFLETVFLESIDSANSFMNELETATINQDLILKATTEDDRLLSEQAQQYIKALYDVPIYSMVVSCLE